MFYRLKALGYRAHFALACRRIYATSPIALDTQKPVMVLTQLQHKDVLLYLTAIKSFAKQVELGKVVIIDDGSLSAKDKKQLAAHLPGVSIFPLSRFRHPACPQGGCWERLLAIARFSQDHYVIQLDSDTLTRGPLPEVRQHIASDTAFVLGTWDGQTIEPMSLCAKRVQAKHPDAKALHVQLAAEAAFTHLEGCDALRYVRGCAGFCGFPAGSIDLDFIVCFSQAMDKLLGPKWHQWGSEQVMSNVLVANVPKAQVLPHPDYSDCAKMQDSTRFIHFVGSCRFARGRYAREARQVIAHLEE